MEQLRRLEEVVDAVCSGVDLDPDTLVAYTLDDLPEAEMEIVRKRIADCRDADAEGS